MRTIALVSACLACAGRGHRVKTTTEQMQYSAHGEHQSPQKAANTKPSSHSILELEQSQSNARDGVPKQLKNLSMLLLALSNPATAFAPPHVTGAGYKIAVTNPNGIRAVSHPAVRMSQSDDIKDLQQKLSGIRENFDNFRAPATDKLPAGALLQPSPALTAIEVISSQLAALQQGDAAGIGEAFAFVSPTNGKRDGADAVARFEAILRGVLFEPLLGCTTWEVLETIELSSEDFAAKVRVSPAPIPGCFDMPSLPLFFSFKLGRQSEGSYAGCWMLEQITPERPPIDVDVEDAPYIPLPPGRSGGGVHMNMGAQSNHAASSGTGSSTTFAKRVAELSVFRERFGHIMVPLDSPTSNSLTPKGLGRWVYAQRKRKIEGKLNELETAALDDLGFRWQLGVEDLDWDEMVERLVAYKAENGDCLVPKKCETDPLLGAWVCACRRKADPLLNGGQSALSPEKQAELDSVGFVWVPERRCTSSFMQGLRLYGEAYVAGEPPDDNWCAAQREARRQGKLSKQRVAYLDKFGFDWDLAC